MHSALRQLVFAFILVGLAGCGQMGPLYLPAEEPAAQDASAAADDAKPADEEG